MAVPLKYNLRSLWHRRSRTALTVLGIAAVIAIFVAMVSFSRGMSRSFETAGSPENVVVLQRSASSQSLSSLPRDTCEAIRHLPGIERRGDRALATPEVVVEPWVSRPGAGEEVFMVARGVEPLFFEVVESIRVTEGRRELGGNRLLLGAAARHKLGEVGLGDELLMFGERWTVSGTFEAGGSSLELAILADLSDLMRAAKRDEYSSITLKAREPAAVGPLIEELESDRRFLVTALREPDYYARSGRTYGIIGRLGLLVALIVSLGAVFGGMNTMYAAVAGRTREVGTLRALGFSGGSILLSFVTEALLIGAGGGLVGVVAGWLVNGLRVNVLSASVRFTVTPEVVAIALGLSLLVGFLGGLLPAWRASRLDVVEALRKA